MKLFKKIFMVFVLGLSALFLAGCMFDDANTISIVKMPDTVFERTDMSSFSGQLMVVNVDNEAMVTISYVQGEVQLSVEGYEITVTNFDLSKVGSFTAMVSYGDAVSYFDYQVVNPASGFSGGDGSATNPFQITEASQLKLLAGGDTYGKFYKVMNDIDCSEAELQTSSWWVGCQCLAGAAPSSNKDGFNGTLDGNGKKLFNLPEGIDSVFGVLNNGTVKNLDVYTTHANLVYISVLGTNIINVDMYGTMESANNWGCYITYGNSCTILIEDCNNYVDMIGTGYKCAVFMGYPNFITSLTIKNSANYGRIEGQRVALVGANNADWLTKVTLEGVVNHGDLIQTVTSDTSLVVGNRAKLTGALAALEDAILNEGKFMIVGDIQEHDITVEVEDGVYVIKEGASAPEVAYYKVALTVPTREKDSATTLRMEYESEKLYAVEGVASTGLHKVATVLQSSAVEGLAPVLGSAKLFFDAANNQLVFSDETHILTSEKIYFVVLAYDANDNLILGSGVTTWALHD